jgi:hypothetical protein
MGLCRKWPPRRHRVQFFALEGEYDGDASDYALCTRCGRLWIGLFRTMGNTWPGEFTIPTASQRLKFYRAHPSELLRR